MSDVVAVEIERLTPHPDNPRRGDVPAIMRSLERFGQVRPIIVQRSTGYVVAGNHVLEAAKRLEWSTVQTLVQDMDDETARAYLIADNRTADRATYDKGALLAVLSEALTLEGTGFEEGDRELLAEELSGAREQQRAEAADPIEIEDREADEPGAPEPMREIALRMTASQIAELSQQVADLQQLWDARTLVEIVTRAVSEAHQRWQAGVGVDQGASSRSALPPELTGTEY